MLFVGLAGLILPATGGLAAADCRCRANGTTFQLGDIVCIGTPGNRRLAQCDMVLNNTSWTILSKECPSAQLMTPDEADAPANATARPAMPTQAPSERDDTRGKRS